MSELESVQSESEGVGIGKFQNLTLCKIGKCQNKKVSESKCVRIKKSQNWKVAD